MAHYFRLFYAFASIAERVFSEPRDLGWGQVLMFGPEEGEVHVAISPPHAFVRATE